MPEGFALADDHDHRACVAGALAAAEGAGGLTPVRRRALEILLESHAAMGAYDVLARLAADGFGAQPPVAYRALGYLVERGLAHRIEGLSAYVACARPEGPHVPAFLVCRGCRAVAECDAPAGLPDAPGFAVERRVVEAEGLCPGCRAAA